MAYANNIIVRTSVMGLADKRSRIIAMSGTPGFRIMHQYTYHNLSDSNYTDFHELQYQNRENTIKQIIKCNNPKDTYSLAQNGVFYSSLPNKLNVEPLKKNNPELLTKPIEPEKHRSLLSAEQCMKINMCDWILENNGKWQKYTKQQKTK